jgi:hypothetical protein
VAEEAVVDREPHAGALDLALARVAAQLPRELAHLRDGLRGDGLAEAAQPTARVHGHATAERRDAVAQQLLGVALRAQADRLVPVELHR